MTQGAGADGDVRKGPPQIEKVAKHLFDVSLDLICIANTEQYFVAVNPAWEHTLGFTRQELMSRPYTDFVHPDDLNATVGESDRLYQGVPVLQFRNRYRDTDGRWHWLSWQAFPGDDGHVYAIAREVTAEVESELQLKARETRVTFLLGEVQRARQEERERLAGEIHDFALQHTLAALMNMEVLEGLLHDADHTRALQIANRSIGLLRNAIGSTRSVLQGLSPLELQKSSLRDAILRFVDEASRSWGVEISCHIPSEIQLAPEHQVVTYRLLSEGITNAAKHSAGTRVQVGAKVEDGCLRCWVEDDGSGFPAPVLDGTYEPIELGGMGLPLMREQLNAIGGELSLGVSHELGGASLRFKVPTEPAEA